MRRRLPITLRLTLWFAAAATFVLTVLGAVLVNLVDRHFEVQDHEALGGKLLQISRRLATIASPGELEQVGALLQELLLGQERLSLAVFSAGGRVLFATTAVQFPASSPRAAMVRAGGFEARPLTWVSGGQHYRALVAALPTGLTGREPVTVAVAVNIAPHRLFLAHFERGLAWALATSVALMSGLSWLAAQRGLAPLREVARLATHISADRLEERLPENTVPVEMTDLTRSFNAMLDRLDAAFRRLREYSADVAHELRTPVSNIMTQTQVALSIDRSAMEYREVLHSVLEEHERLARMIDEMLYLSSAENGMLVLGDEAVDLIAQARSLGTYFEPMVADKRLTLRISGRAMVRGDRLMLRRALANLLSNAIRHAPVGGTVEVRAATFDGEQRLELSVVNPGSEIAPEHLPRLFDRFYQVDPSRSRTGGGAGLGLAIVKSIALAHQATIRAECEGGEVRFVLAFAGQRLLEASCAASSSAHADLIDL